MIRTHDETIANRLPLPVVCGLLERSHHEAGFHPALCSRCERPVLVNSRVDTMLIQAGIVRVLVCVMCWCEGDQAVVLSYKEQMK